MKQMFNYSLHCDKRFKTLIRASEEVVTWRRLGSKMSGSPSIWTKILKWSRVKFESIGHLRYPQHGLKLNFDKDIFYLRGDPRLLE